MVFVHRAETVPFYRSRYELYLEQRGVFTRLAGPSTTPPGGAAPLRDFQSAKLLLDGVTFLARDTTGRQALYSWRRGVLRTLVDEQSLGERVASFWMAALGDRVALLNIPTSSSASVQLVDGDGAVTELVRIGDVAPGGNTVTRLSGLAASDEMLVISAETNAGGALLGWDDAAGMGVVVDQSTMLPGLARPYEPARLFQGSSSLFSVSGRSVDFVQNRFVPGAMPECVGGVFLWESGSVRQVAGNRDRNPETNQELKCFYSAFLGAQGLWFRATTVSISSGPGISLPTYGDLLTRRGPKLLRVFGLDRLGDERVYTYRPVMDEDRAVLLLGIDRPSSARARYGAYEIALGAVGTAVPSLSLLGTVFLAVALAAVAWRRL